MHLTPGDWTFPSGVKTWTKKEGQPEKYPPKTDQNFAAYHQSKYFSFVGFILSGLGDCLYVKKKKKKQD